MAVAALSAVERIRKREEEKRIKCNNHKASFDTGLVSLFFAFISFFL
jgi:hypothetical protein